MEEKIVFLNKHKEELSGILHYPAKKSNAGVVLANCFTCTKDQRIVRRVAEHLAENGFLALRFDFSGNGESEGRFEEATYSKEISDLQCAVSFLSKNANTIGLFGYSMGASISIMESQCDKRVQSVCVLGSSSEASSIKSIFPKERIDEVHKKGKAIVRLYDHDYIISKEFLEDTTIHNISNAVKTLKKPICFIHGEKDDILDVSHAKKLFATSTSKKELHIIKNADHLLAKHDYLAEAEQIIAEWFKKTL